MKLVDFLNVLPVSNLIKIPEGKSLTVKDFYEDCISRVLPTKGTIIKWDALLDSYLNDEEAILFIRRYGSGGNYSLLRRGFLTKHQGGLGYVYSDNYLAQYFYLMAIQGFVPNIEELKNMINNRQFPYGFRETSEEKVMRAYPKGGNTKINPYGWKLAHMFSVNGDDYNFDYKKECNSIFPRGQRIDWIKEDGYYLRQISENLSEDIKAKYIAHFLRFVHPINHFLVPKNGFEKGDHGSNVGELRDLLAFVRLKQKEKFGDLLGKYEERIMASDKLYRITNDVANRVINIEYGKRMEETKKDKLKKDKAKSSKEIKVGKLVRQKFVELVENKAISNNLAISLSNKETSKKLLGINYAFLKKVDDRVPIKQQKSLNGRVRYWNDRIVINDEEYLMCKEWYERNRGKFLEWVKSLPD